MAKATEDNVTPIRPLDEEEAIAWLRAQPGASTTLPAAELARRWGWQEHRVRRRLNAWQKSGLIRRRGRVVTAVGTAVVPTPNPTPNRTPIPTPDPTAKPAPVSGVGNLIQHLDPAKDVEAEPTVGFSRSIAIRNAAQNAAEITSIGQRLCCPSCRVRRAQSAGTSPGRTRVGPASQCCDRSPDARGRPGVGERISRL